MVKLNIEHWRHIRIVWRIARASQNFCKLNMRLIGQERRVGPAENCSGPAKCPGLLVWGAGSKSTDQLTSWERRPLSESPTCSVGHSSGGKKTGSLCWRLCCDGWQMRASLYFIELPRTVSVDEDFGSNGRGHKKAEEPNLSISDVRLFLFVCFCPGRVGKLRVLSIKQKQGQTWEQSSKGNAGAWLWWGWETSSGSCRNQAPTEPTAQGEPRHLSK